jgi:hypothetical protein
MSYRVLFCLLVLAHVTATCPAADVSIFTDGNTPQIQFAARELSTTLKSVNHTPHLRTFDTIREDTAPLRIILTTDSPDARHWLDQSGAKPIDTLSPQGYALRRTTNGNITTIRAIGADPTGAMYAGLAIAEHARLHKSLDALTDTTESAQPFIPRRGVKFNFPLDARTPSYDDTGDSAQSNIETMWDFAFWEAYLDEMARNRYNTLTLWNPHPFPSMVKLPNYPEVPLDDVCVTTLKPTFEHGKWGDPQGVTPEILSNLKIVKRMTIDDKIAFWRKVMRHAKDRGIDVFIITWNVLVNSAEGKHGITGAQDNPVTIAYVRECVRELVLTYPDLTGIGITAGERMKDRDDQFDREKWLWAAYGEGVLDAKKHQPNRKIEFIHRHWQTDVGKLVQAWSRYPDPFYLEFKYARARLFSSPNIPFEDSLVEEMKPHGLKSWWNLRNDDIFVFRWGDPDYVRAFLKNLPPEQFTAGYVVGSDGYVWAREFNSIEPETPPRLEVHKHWYNFMLWGRLGYDPSLDHTFFAKHIHARFPEARDVPLYDAWQRAGQIIPLVNRFHWQDWDYLWSVEGCIDQRWGFHNVRSFIKNPTMEKSGLLTIPQYVRWKLSNSTTTPPGTTPLEVAEELRSHAKTTLNLLKDIRIEVKQPSKELRLTLGDLEAQSHLGLYYSSKILGATDLHLFEQSKRDEHKHSAVTHLNDALTDWRNYARVATSQYKPQLLARTRELDWDKLTHEVERDVEIVGQTN